MGYCMTQKEDKFFIHNDSKLGALAAIKALQGFETYKDASGAHFSWVTTEEFMEAKTLEEALDAWRWQATTDDTGNIVSLSFSGEKLGDDITLFKAIAPYVESGSFIEMVGEDGQTWRWTFKNGKADEEQAKIVFDDPEGDLEATRTVRSRVLVTTYLVIDHAPDVSVDDVISEMDYNFTADNGGKATIGYTEIMEFNVQKSEKLIK